MSATSVIDGLYSYLRTATEPNLLTAISPYGVIVKHLPRLAVMQERRAMPIIACSVQDVADDAIAVNGRGGLRGERITIGIDVMFSMTHPEPADDQAEHLVLVEKVQQKLRKDPSWGGVLVDGGRGGLSLSGRWMNDPASVVQQNDGVLWWRWTTTATVHPNAV